MAPPVRLCNGCRYELRSWTNFLRAQGFTVAFVGVPGEDEGLLRGEEARDVS